MIVKQIRLKQDFYNTLNELLNTKNLEDFGYKSTHISIILKDLRDICTKSEMDVFVDEAVQAIAYFANAN